VEASRCSDLDFDAHEIKRQVARSIWGSAPRPLGGDGWRQRDVFARFTALSTLLGEAVMIGEAFAVNQLGARLIRPFSLPAAQCR
jgi:hypothetical protein